MRSDNQGVARDQSWNPDGRVLVLDRQSLLLPRQRQATKVKAITPPLGMDRLLGCAQQPVAAAKVKPGAFC
jgi:hypothetical protein